ncbi:hypothetical protein [Serratia marcescens]|uniref:hypothetical protein n=1 Tax=Serratia marcescens TaxID=615 RepID=UPI0027E3C4BD|nr:hypothetical protein [Serratia marcescens]
MTGKDISQKTKARNLFVAAIIFIPDSNFLLILLKRRPSEPNDAIACIIAKIEAAKAILPKSLGPIYLATNEVTYINPNIDTSFSDIIQNEFIITFLFTNNITLVSLHTK